LNLRPHPSYKASGVEWLGDVPKHWDIPPLYTRFRIELGKMLDESRITGKHLVPYLRNVDVQWDSIDFDDLPEMDIYAHEYERYTLKQGDLLVCEGGEVGRSAIFKSNGTVIGFQKALHRLRPANGSESSRFMFYTLNWASMLGVFLAEGNPNTIPHLTGEKLRRYRFPSPPVDEQRAIAAFLDRETAKLDTLAEKKRALIGKLKEKRAALISRTVTRGLPPAAARAAGLNPHPKLKPSGVEWIGEVPEHWNVMRGRFCMRVNPPSEVLRQLADDEDVSFVPMEAVGEDGSLVLDIAKPKGEIGGSYTEFQDGDVVVAKITPCFENGKGALASGLVNGAALGTTELHVLRPLPSLDRLFLFYLTISSIYRMTGEAEMYGAGGQKRVPPEFNKNFRTPLPPITEQHTIADYLNRETTKIDRLIEKVEAAIERLREYRSALITAAVTGKIDVRGVRADNVAITSSRSPSRHG
jgi:type I restriction enzyme, S subunit